MRTLILLRHGKSDWDAAYAADHERPLAQRGREAARCIGRLLRHIDQVPDLAVTSSAVRARDTLQRAVRAGHWHCPVRVEPALYESSPESIVVWLRALKDNPESLLLTGHEPTWSTLAGRLVGGARLRVPTGCVLRIDFDIDDWSAVAEGSGELLWLMPPKAVCRLQGQR